MKNRLIALLFVVGFALVVCCKKSITLTAREELLTAGPWKAQRIDTVMFNGDTIMKTVSLIDSCYQGTIITFAPNGSATYRFLCGIPSPATVGGDWSVISDTTLKTHSVNDPERYYYTIRTLTSDSLKLEFPGYGISVSYPYPFYIRRVYSH